LRDRFSSVVVMTYNVERDIAYLNALAGARRSPISAPSASRERSARMRMALPANTLQLFAPAGLDVGSETQRNRAGRRRGNPGEPEHAHGGSLSRADGPNP